MAKKRGNHEGSIVRRKDGRWMAIMSMGRNPNTGKLKRVYFYGKTRQEAAHQLASALADWQHGRFVAPHKITVGQWLDTWLQEYKRHQIRSLTLDQYEMLIRCHLKPALGHSPLRELRAEHLQRLYNTKWRSGRLHGRSASEGLSADTIRCMHSVMHGALKQAMRNQLVAQNVSEATTLPRVKRPERIPLSLDDIPRVLEAFAGHRLYAAMYLELSTGLRLGEVLGLRWQDLDFDAGLLHVRQSLVRVRNHEAREGQTKTHLVFQVPKTSQSRRTLPLPDDIIQELRHHKARQAQEKLLFGPSYQDHDLVFCHPTGTPLEPRDISYRFTQVLRKAGLPALRFHDVRHSYATALLELGESPKTVQTMLGHTKIATTMDIYSHVSLELETRAAARLNSAITIRRKLRQQPEA